MGTPRPIATRPNHLRVGRDLGDSGPRLAHYAHEFLLERSWVVKTRLLMTAAVALGAWLNTAAVIRAADVPDAWITVTTQIALLTAENVSTSNLNVETVNGVSMVRCTVPTDLHNFNAGHTAMKVRGVTAVNNLLQVVPNSQKAVVERSDEQVKQGVEAAFKADARVKDSGITVA